VTSKVAVFDTIRVYRYYITFTRICDTGKINVHDKTVYANQKRRKYGNQRIFTKESI